MPLGILSKAEVRVMHEFKMQPTEVDNLEFARFSVLIEYIKELDKSNSEEAEQGKGLDMKKQMKSYQKGFKTPKMPKLPKK